MRNCMIMGSGRCGTSLVAGLLARCGYDMGKDLYPARAANPKGFFEGPEINGINEDLLAAAQPPDLSVSDHQRWLARFPKDVKLTCVADIQQRIKDAVGREPFCFKDPRFSYTLPAWRPFLPDVGLICIFRDPHLTALSIVEECQTAAYLQDLEMNQERALQIWEAAYRQILDVHRQTGDWLFVHKDQLLSDSGQDRLAAFLKTDAIDRSFPDQALNRQPPQMRVPKRIRRLYRQLCELAMYQEPTAHPGRQRGEPIRAQHVREKAARRASANVDEGTPDVSFILPLASNEEPALLRLAAEIRAQRGVRCELIIVDGTPRETLNTQKIADCTVIRAPYDSQAHGFWLGLRQASGRFAVWLDPNCILLPSHCGHATELLDRNPDLDLAASDLILTDEAGQFQAGEEPLQPDVLGRPFWQATLVMRRAFAATAAETVHPAADPEAFLSICRQSLARGRVGVVRDPGVCVPEDVHAAAQVVWHEDVDLLRSTPQVGNKSVPDISVILCSYNRAPKVRRCLEALRQQTLARERFEVICINDGSTDDTGAVMRAGRQDLPGKIIDHPENRALAAARNSALDAATGRILLFINDDTYPEPTMLAEHLRAHRIYPGLRKAVLGNIFNRPEIEHLLISQVLERFDMIFPFTRTETGRPYGFDHFITGNVSVPRAAFAAHGIRFEEGFLRYGCEDVEAGYRLHKLGYRVWYHPDARAAHDHRMTVSAFARRTRDNNANLIQFMDMHPELVDHYLKQPRLDEETVTIWRAKVQLFASQCQELEAKLTRLENLDIRKLGPQADAIMESMAKGLSRVLWHHMMHAMLQTLDALPEVRARLVTPSLAAPVTDEAYIANSTLSQGSRASAQSITPPTTDLLRSAHVRAPHPEQVEVFASDAADKARPHVSVVIPCYNREDYLAETVQSVLQQPERAIEIIMVDDGSTDGTRQVALSLLRSHPERALKLACQTNSGGPAAPRNTGIKLARGRWILPLDSDDKLSSHAVGDYLAATGMVGRDSAVIYGKLQYFGTSKDIWHTEAVFHPNVLLRRALVPATAMFSRELFERTGGYKDLSYEDWEFWLNCAKCGARFVHVPRITLLYRAQEEVSRGKTDRSKHDWAMARIYLQHPELYEDQELNWAADYLHRFESPPAARPRYRPDDPFPLATALLIANYPGLYTADEIVWTTRWLSTHPVVLRRGLRLDRGVTSRTLLIAGYGGLPDISEGMQQAGQPLTLRCAPQNEHIAQVY